MQAAMYRAVYMRFADCHDIWSALSSKVTERSCLTPCPHPGRKSWNQKSTAASAYVSLDGRISKSDVSFVMKLHGCE
jgi:hypothetical protein